MLLDTLATIVGQTRPPDAVYVVDNASEDDTAERIRQRFPESSYIRLGDNVGYGAGLAAGMKAARANGFDAFWLMDDDSQADPEALECLLAAGARASAQTGIIGFRGGVLRFGLIRHLDGPQRLRRRPAAAPGAFRVDFTLVDGALVLGRAVESIGFPRTDFFMMMEDVEYSLRARAAGLDVLVLERDLMRRKHLGSTGPSRPWRGYYQTRNHLRFALDMRSPRLLFGWLVRQLRFGAAALRAPDQRGARIRLRARGARDGLRGRMGRVVEPSEGPVLPPGAKHAPADRPRVNDA